MSQYWYIALIPDEPEYSRIEEFTRLLKGRLPATDLPSPPFHITLVAPFLADEALALSALKSLVGVVPAFKVNTSKFEYFAEYRSWYLGIEQHRYFANLETIARQSLGDAAPNRHSNRIYHLTVARRDETDASSIELSKLLSGCSVPCARLRFKRVVLIRRKNAEHPAKIQHTILLHASE